MLALAARCAENEIEHELIDANELKQREPRISGLAAIHAPMTGIVNYQRVNLAMVDQFVAAGGDLRRRHQVTGLTERSDHIRIDI